MLLVQEVMNVARDVRAVPGGESGSRASGFGNRVCVESRRVVKDTGNRVCVESQRVVEDTGNRVWGVRRRAGRRRRDRFRGFAGYRCGPSRDTGNGVWVPGCGVEGLPRSLSVWTRNTGGCA
jgi:hypothetical protein